MEFKGLLLCSYEPTTGPYPEPDESGPHCPVPFNIHFNIIPHLCLGLPSGCFPSGFPTNNFVRTSHLSHAYYMPCSSHTPFCAHPNNIWRTVQIMKLFSMQFSHTFCYFSILGPNILITLFSHMQSIFFSCY